MFHSSRTCAVAALCTIATALTASPLRAEPLPIPLGLHDAVAYALTHNPDIIRTRAALDSAIAESLAAGVRTYNPALDLEAARGGSSLSSASDRSVSVGLSQTIEWPGKRSARRAVASAQLATGRAELAAEEQRVVLAVRRLYRRAGVLGTRRTAQEHAAALDRELAVATARRVRQDVLTPFAGRLIELDASRSEAAVLAARTELHATMAELHALLGAPAEAVIEAAPETLSEAAAGEAPAESLLVARALARRPDLAPLRERLAVARAQERLAGREARPDPAVGLALESSRDEIEAGDIRGDPAITSGITSIVDRSTQVRARVSVPVPLFNRNQAARARARAAVTLALSDIARREAAIHADVHAASVRDADARALLALYDRVSQSARSDLDLVRGAYRAGRLSLEDYLTDKSRLIEALERSLDAAERAAAARSDLEAAVGGPLDESDGGTTR